MSTLSIVPREPDRLTEIVAAEVRAHMARARINQTQLAGALGLTQSSVSKRLRGVVAFNTDELQTVANLLGVHPAELLGGNAGSPIPPNTPRSLHFLATQSDGPGLDYDIASEGPGEFERRQLEAA